jgi:hypothetical protein
MIDFNVPTGISRLLGTGTVALSPSGILTPEDLMTSPLM